LPRHLPGRVVQQDQPARGDLLVAAEPHRGTQRVRVGSQPLRRGQLGQLDLRAGPHRAQLLDGEGEGVRDHRRGRHSMSLFPSRRSASQATALGASAANQPSVAIQPVGRYGIWPNALRRTMDGAVAVRTGLVLGVTILLGGSVLLFAVVALLAYLPHRLRTPTRARRRAVQAQWREQAAVLTERAELARARAARSARELAAAEPASAAAWRELEAAQAAYDEAVQRYQRLRDGGGPTV